MKEVWVVRVSTSVSSSESNVITV